MNHRTHRNAEIPPQVDEAWWAALLADEEKHTPSNSNPKSNGSHHAVASLGGERHSNSGEEMARAYGYESSLLAEAPSTQSDRTIASEWDLPGANDHSTQDEDHAGNLLVQNRIANVDWDLATHLFNEDRTVSLDVTGFNRGGLLVDGEGLHGFLPVSHLVQVTCELDDAARELVMERYIGNSVLLKVIECDPERGRVVFSERAALAAAGRRNELLQDLHPGECVRGLVTNITDFGVFVDLGGIEGLIHVSEISWGRVNHPSDIVQVGEEVTAYIINLDRDRSRIALSLKRLCSNPWETASERYTPGQIVDVVVTSVVPFGAFARLEEGLDGLIHITEIDRELLGVQDVKQLEGREVRARILHIDAQRQRLGLSLHGVDDN